MGEDGCAAARRAAGRRRAVRCPAGTRVDGTRGGQDVAGGLQVWTVGHSNHPLERFVDLVRSASIEVVADVRSQPYSRHNQHFNQAPLRAALAGAGLRYAFLGEELGGRPREPWMYDQEGHVLYGEVARSARFREGVERVRRGAASWRVALMCSEEDPTGCHRRLLIARVLREEGIGVVHLRGDGSTIDDEDLTATAGAEQPSLFAPGGE